MSYNVKCLSTAFILNVYQTLLRIMLLLIVIIIIINIYYYYFYYFIINIIIIIYYHMLSRAKWEGSNKVQYCTFCSDFGLFQLMREIYLLSF